MPRLEAFFYVDSDLIVVREAFIDSLQLRAQAHGWLAAYGHRVRREKPYDTRNDQSVLSDFVFRYFTYWDFLYTRFNCRGILRFKDDLPLEDCLGIHDCSESDVLRGKLNLSLMHLGI